MPHLRKSRNASIVNLSSAAGRLGFPLRTPYASSKWAVVGFTKSLSIELGEAGIRVNTCRDPARRGGVVTLDVPNGMEVTRELSRREVLVDYRPAAGIRVAPHFYTTDEEVDRVVSEIRAIAAS